MKKILFIACVSLCLSTTLTSCNWAKCDATEEAVFVYQPWFFGHGGVDPEPATTGLSWCFPSTHVSDDNTPLDFHTIIITQIETGKCPVLLQNYGVDSVWFNTNLYNYYANLIRDHVSQHSPFDLMSNRQVLNSIDSAALKAMQIRIAELSKDKEFPVKIKQVTIGKAIPNKEQLAEMNRTAQAVQAKQTQLREKEMQDARAEAERARAVADKAYMREMNLSTSDFVNLKWIETISKLPQANVNVMVGGGTTPMYRVNK